METDSIVVAVDERCDVFAQMIEIAVLAGMDFLPLERLHEALAGGVGLGPQLLLIRTV